MLQNGEKRFKILWSSHRKMFKVFLAIFYDYYIMLEMVKEEKSGNTI